MHAEHVKVTLSAKLCNMTPYVALICIPYKPNSTELTISACSRLLSCVECSYASHRLHTHTHSSSDMLYRLRYALHSHMLGTLGLWAVWLVWLVAPTGKADVFTFKQYPAGQSPAVVVDCCVNEGLQNRL